MAKFKIKKGDTVVVLAGGDKGKTGEVKQILIHDDKVLVAGINVKTKHEKPSQTGPGGLKKIEKPIHISNVALVDPKTSKPTRIGYKDKNGTKVRVAKRSGAEIEG